MVRGRKPVPTALKLVAGQRQDRINHDEPQPQEGMPQCPSNDPDVIEVWDYAATQLAQMRVLTMADRDLLGVYCEAVVQYRRAAEMLKVSVLTGDGEHRHPATLIQKDAALLIRSLGSDFGFSPAARSRIKVADQKPKADAGANPARLLSS